MLSPLAVRTSVGNMNMDTCPNTLYKGKLVGYKVEDNGNHQLAVKNLLFKTFQIRQRYLNWCFFLLGLLSFESPCLKVHHGRFFQRPRGNVFRKVLFGLWVLHTATHRNLSNQRGVPKSLGKVPKKAIPYSFTQWSNTGKKFVPHPTCSLIQCFVLTLVKVLVGEYDGYVTSNSNMSPWNTLYIFREGNHPNIPVPKGHNRVQNDLMIKYRRYQAPSVHLILTSINPMLV